MKKREIQTEKLNHDLGYLKGVYNYRELFIISGLSKTKNPSFANTFLGALEQANKHL